MRQTRSTMDTGESPEIEQLVRLHHRRRGWAWVAVGSWIGLGVYVGIGAALFQNLTGTAEIASVVPVVVLLALAVIGVVMIIVDHVRIRRADPDVRLSAKGRVSHYPLYAHAHRYPARHRGSRVWAIFMLIVMTAITVALLPAEVDSVAYVAGAETQDTFNPVSYGQSCSRHSCHTVTYGYLSGTDADVTWGSQVPLDQSFPVRDPLWTWGTGRNLIGSDGSAITMIVVGLFFNAVAIFFVYVLAMTLRHMSFTRRKEMAGLL